MAIFDVSRQRPLGRGLTLIVGVIALVALGFGADRAYAFWTSSGSGTGSATTGTALNVTVAAGTSTTPLQPNGSGDLAFTVLNPNAFSVQITALSIASQPTACTDPQLTLTFTTPLTVPANSSPTPASFDLPAALHMGVGASSDCQGKTFSVPLTATVQR